MNEALMLEYAWKSALCAGSALLLIRLLRGRSAAEKSVIAHLGLLALVLLPFGAATLPELRFAAPEAIQAPLASLAPALLEQPSAPAGRAAAAADGGIDWTLLAMLAYAAAASTLLLMLAVALLRLRRIRREAKVVVDPRWLTALARAQNRIGHNKGTALLVSGEIDSPVSYGVLRPVIILDSAAAADSAHAEAIVAHELAHVVRLDWLKLLLGRIAVALFWFNPLVWILARNCHQLCEEAADDAVLLSDVPREDYADLLVGTVRHANRGALLAANGVAPGRSSLGRRIAHVLDPAQPRRPARARWALASLAAAVAWNGALAAAAPAMPAPLALAASATAGRDSADALDRLDTPQARALARALRSGDWGDRLSGGSTLFDEPAAIAPLVAALDDRRPQQRRIAIWGLSEMRPAPGPEAAAAVARHLSDPDAAVRTQAARALGDFGEFARAAEIARLLGDPDRGVRAGAAHALGDLQSPETRPALERALSDPDPGVRSKAGWALRQVDEAERFLARRRGG
jgi:beta-lactamase regulating signal transducer with metallopeptidase domain